MNRPSLWELECFAALGEELQFFKAAKRLHISQPPLSRQIQALEKKLGLQLLRTDISARVPLLEPNPQNRPGK
jgi:DNA-binding transcriptional LysR family regulator